MRGGRKSFSRVFAAVAGRDLGDVVDYNVHLHSDGHLYDTHEIYAGPDGMVYFTQRMHDRVGRFTLDGRAELFDLPKGSRPHGLRFSDDGRFYVTLENLIKLLSSVNVMVQSSLFTVLLLKIPSWGVVGPHGCD